MRTPRDKACVVLRSSPSSVRTNLGSQKPGHVIRRKRQSSAETVVDSGSRARPSGDTVGCVQLRDAGKQEKEGSFEDHAGTEQKD